MTEKPKTGYTPQNKTKLEPEKESNIQPEPTDNDIKLAINSLINELELRNDKAYALTIGKLKGALIRLEEVKN